MSRLSQWGTGLESDGDTGREKVRCEHRHSDSEISVHSILEFLGSSFDDLFSFCERVVSSVRRFKLFVWIFGKGEFLDLFLSSGLDDPVDVDSRDVDLSGIKFAWFDDLFCFYDSDFGISGHCAVEIVCGETEDTITWN